MLPLSRHGRYRFIYGALGVLAILLALGPSGGVVAGAWPIDWLTAITFRMALRRKEATPLMLVFLLGLLRDFLGGWPLGAGAMALAFVAAQGQGWNERVQNIPFWQEWVALALAATFVSLAPWIAASLSFAPQAGTGAAGRQILATFLCYPLVALATRRLAKKWTSPKMPRI